MTPETQKLNDEIDKLVNDLEQTYATMSTLTAIAKNYRNTKFQGDWNIFKALNELKFFSKGLENRIHELETKVEERTYL